LAAAPRSRCRAAERAHLRPGALAGERALFEAHRRHPDPALRELLVVRFLPLARHVAMCFEQSGHSREDLVQVACLALVKAVDRFDPGRGVAFSSYAVPTMIGEMKRYVRDTAWAVHVPRPLQERSARTTTAAAELSRGLGRRPTVAEIARALDCRADEVREALAVTDAHRAASLESSSGAGDDPGPAAGLREAIGYDDERLAMVERRADLAPLVGCLEQTERAALWLRYECDMTRSEIAGTLGLSQIAVARILRRALERLRSLQERQAS
jgi:RNA polymerase sigma-B factor